jgi:Pyruvate/2-oxoacid:ferredoxin oxidoreductase delta subunit
MKTVRKIVQIDEERCDGCGLCIPNCAEGALQIIDGKARLVSDVYCDGLGACLGHCPQDAISIVEREAAEFDEEAVLEHVRKLQVSECQDLACGCPGTAVRTLKRENTSHGVSPDLASELAQWPVQLTLVPAGAPYLKGADLLVAADCAPFAYANFHRDFLKDHAVVVGCPKLDDFRMYRDKLETIFREARPASITVAHLEVPCCFALRHLVSEALKAAGGKVPVKEVTIGVDGTIKNTIVA